MVQPVAVMSIGDAVMLPMSDDVALLSMHATTLGVLPNPLYVIGLSMYSPDGTWEPESLPALIAGFILVIAIIFP